MKNQPTPGGNRLRALREFYNKTQFDVELDASLGIGYLQRLELGRVKQPERDTLERILAALNAQYTERREVLELFGYIVDAPIPTEHEIEWAISVCQYEINNAVFPAYLLDCAHRILYWNPHVPKLFDLSKTTTAEHQSMLKMIFDPKYGMTARIQNSEDFFTAQIRALRYEIQRFLSESWCASLIDDMLQHPQFEHYWDQDHQKTVHIPARPLTPFIINIDDQTLHFRLISETFVQDHRFRVIFCLPADAFTIQECVRWLSDPINIP